MTNEVNDKTRQRKNETKKKWDQETRDGQKGDEGKKEIREPFWLKLHNREAFLVVTFSCNEDILVRFRRFVSALFWQRSFGEQGGSAPDRPWVEDQSRRCRGSQGARRVRCLVQDAIEWSGIRCLEPQMSLFRPRLTISRAVPRQRRQTWRSLPQFVQRNRQTSENRKRNCWTWSTRWEGRSPSSKRRWKEDLRWCNCRGLAASSRLSV